MKLHKLICFAACTLLFAILAACGGGGGSSNSAPTVTMLTPVNGATSVSINPSIQLKFSKAVQGVDTTSITLHEGSAGGASVTIDSILPGAGNTYTFSPEQPLKTQTLYFVVVSSAITDSANRPLAATTFSFTTGTSDAPTVSLINPADGATNVSASPSIQIRFSEAVSNVNTTNVKLYQGIVSSGTQVTLGAITTGSENTYTFSPAASLVAQTVYILVVDSGIVDSDNNALATTTFSFKTGTLTIPTVSIISPANGAVNVNTSATPTIHLQFSEAVQNVNANISVHQGSAGGSLVNIGAITPVSSNGYTFSPSAALLSETAYFVVVGSGITDASGNPLTATTFSFTTGVLSSWTSQVGASGGDTEGYGVGIDDAGNSYVAGSTTAAISGQTQTGAEDYFIAKYNPSGVLQWTHQVGGSSGTTMALGVSVDGQGNSYVAGFTTVGISGQTQQGAFDYFIAKYNTSGVLQWAHQVGAAGGGETAAFGVTVDSSGNSYVAGYTSRGISGQTQAGVNDYFVAKYNASGTLQWTRQVGAVGGETIARGIGVDSAGNSYIAGYTSVAISGQTLNGFNDYFTAKYNSSGALQWTHLVGGATGITEGLAIHVDSSGNSHAAGYTTVALAGQSQNGFQDYFIAKYNASGVLQWGSQLGALNGLTQAFGISVDSTGNSYVTGATDSGLGGGSQNGVLDYFLAKHNALGVYQSVKQVGVSSSYAFGNGIKVDSAGNSFVTGYTEASISNPSTPQNGILDYFIAYNFGAP